MHYKLEQVVLTTENTTLTFRKFFFAGMGISDIDESITDTLQRDGRKIEVVSIEIPTSTTCILHLRLNMSDGYEITKGRYSSVTEIRRNGVQCGHIPDEHPDMLFLG